MHYPQGNKPKLQTSQTFKEDWVNFEHSNIDLDQHYVWCKPLTYYYIPLRAQYFNSIGLHITSLALFTIYSLIWKKICRISTITNQVKYKWPCGLGSCTFKTAIFSSFWKWLGSSKQYFWYFYTFESLCASAQDHDGASNWTGKCRPSLYI